MTYIEYKKASLRHLDTCLFLCEFFDEIVEQEEKEHILKNIYYLSGYIFECIFSYAIFNVIGYDKTKSVYQLDNDKRCGLTFSNNFKTHNLDWKIEFLKKNGGSNVGKIPILDGKTKEFLLKKWKSEYRYYIDIELSKNEIYKFVSLAKDTTEKVRLFITKD